MMRKHTPALVAALFLVAFLLSGVDGAIPTDNGAQSGTARELHVSEQLRASEARQGQEADSQDD